MNSRNSVNETNLVNFSAELSTLNQLESKDGLLSFPFDHIYACHSQSAERRPPLQLEKEVEISTYCVTVDDKNTSSTPEVSKLADQLTVAVNQNKKLKDLLIYHLDLIQQQNELITKRDKLYQALKEENDTLKAKLIRMDRRVGLSHRHTHALSAPTATITSGSLGEAGSSQIMLNSYTELLLPDKGNTFLFDKNKPFGQTATFGIARAIPESVVAEVHNYTVPETVLPSTSTSSSTEKKPKSESTKMIETKRTSKNPTSSKRETGKSQTSCKGPSTSKTHSCRAALSKSLASRSQASKSIASSSKCQASTGKCQASTSKCQASTSKSPALASKSQTVSKSQTPKTEESTETRPDPMYTVASNSGTPIQRLQRNRRRTSGSLGSLHRMSKKTETPEPSTSTAPTSEGETCFDKAFSTKKTKTLNTYGKSRTTATVTSTTTTLSKSQFGSLSDRLQLIDTTPTGEDPYQLGEADMREQSPIPKLMLQKTNHGRMKIRDNMGESSRMFHLSDTKANVNRFMSAYDNVKKEPEKTLIITDPDLDLVKTEPEIDWRLYEKVTEHETEVKNEVEAETLNECEFSYGDGSSDLGSLLPSLDASEFQELFSSDAVLTLDSLNELDVPDEKIIPEKTKKRTSRTTSLVNTPEEELVEPKRGADSRRGRKRAFSATGPGKQPKPAVRAKATRGKTAARGKKSPVPGMMTNKAYPTLVGDPDLSWYFGLDPDLKIDDLDLPTQNQASTVEVPRWREKPYTSSYTLEGTENVDDKVFEKRHQKLEAEERRQLRWHMRRIREQRHVERLRQRQRDWSTVSLPSVYSLWQRPQHAKYIEITNGELPVTAFGEPLPQLQLIDFMLPWVRTSKAQKRSKRSKTLH